MKILPRGTYFGSLQSEFNFDGILISEYDYLIDSTDWHYHENPYFMYVLQGNLYDVNRKNKTNCPPGSFLLHNWQEAHFNSKETSKARGFHVEFDRSWYENKSLDISLFEGSSLLENPKSHHLIAKIYYEFKVQDVFSKVSIEMLLFQLCEQLATDKDVTSNQRPQWLEELVQILHANQDDVTLTSLSKQLGVHPGHISRAVPKYLETTLGDYIRQQKIKKAAEHLMAGKLSLLDITFHCGFSDQSHFIRTFRAFMGMTPLQFKNFYRVC